MIIKLRYFTHMIAFLSIFDLEATIFTTHCSLVHDLHTVYKNVLYLTFITSRCGLFDMSKRSNEIRTKSSINYSCSQG